MVRLRTEKKTKEKNADTLIKRRKEIVVSRITRSRKKKMPKILANSKDWRSRDLFLAIITWNDKRTKSISSYISLFFCVFQWSFFFLSGSSSSDPPPLFNQLFERTMTIVWHQLFTRVRCSAYCKNEQSAQTCDFVFINRLNLAKYLLFLI